MLAINKKKLLKSYLIQDHDNLMAFDLAAIESRFKFLADNNTSNLRVIFPVKSFSHPQILTLAKRYLDGFDISNINELNSIKDFTDESSLLWCSSPFIIEEISKMNIIYDVNSYEKLSVNTALRVDPDFLTSYKSRSRFGISANSLLLDQELTKFNYIHFHYASEMNSFEDYKEIINYSTKLCTQKSLKKLTVNLGGGFTHFSNEDFEMLFKYINQFPDINFIIEPGRFYSTNAGLLFGRVKDYLKKDSKHFITTSISSLSHLKWACEKIGFSFFNLNSNCEKFSIDGNTESYLLGATCSERDLIIKTNKNFNFSIDDIIIISNLNGYCAGWNHEFNGIEKAQIDFF